MEEEVLYKNNPSIESKKRLNMAYLALNNPDMMEVLQKNKTCFFHGTNANALPGILKYGINSVDTSKENNIPVTTGEKWSRIDGKRNFVSLTDCIHTALRYADRLPIEENDTNTLLNFGAVIGVSLEDMKDIRVESVMSDLSEVGVRGNLPVDHIKVIAVPEDKVEFVKKMVGQKDIEVVSMNIRDEFYYRDRWELLNYLEQRKEASEQVQQPEIIYSKEEVRTVVKERRTSKIKDIFSALKNKITKKDEKTEDKNISERG